MVELTLPDRVGGRPALDFVNTVDPRHDAGRQEFLTDYPALLAWAGSLEVPLPAPVELLAQVAAGQPEQARAALQRALALRESLYAVFAASLRRQQVSDGDLDLINQRLCQATDHHLLRPDRDGGGVRDGWIAAQSLDSPLWPVVIDAWDVLTIPVLDRVRECPGEDGACGWLFLDASRAGNRRWCDMRTCGNRSKVRAHYSRERRSTST